MKDEIISMIKCTSERSYQNFWAFQKLKYLLKNWSTGTTYTKLARLRSATNEENHLM